ITPPAGDSRALSTLLDRGADATIKDGEGRTLLMRASASDLVPPATIGALIARGADLTAVSPKGDRAVDFARLHGHTAIVDLVAGPHSSDNSGRRCRDRCRRPAVACARADGRPPTVELPAGPLSWAHGATAQ